MPRLLIVGTSDDVDVTHGFRMLLEQKTITEIFLPDAEPNETHDQIIMAASEKNIPVQVGSSLEDLLESLPKEDLVALAWDDSDECFETVLWATDNKREIWDISDGLNIIDMEAEVLEERLEEVLQDFTETLAALVYKMVMDQVDEQGKRKYRRSE
jgi:hypothetical protein